MITKRDWAELQGDWADFRSGMKKSPGLVENIVWETLMVVLGITWELVRWVLRKVLMVVLYIPVMLLIFAAAVVYTVCKVLANRGERGAA